MDIVEATNLDLDTVNGLYKKLHPQELKKKQKPISDVLNSHVEAKTYLVKSDNLTAGFLLLLHITYWDFSYTEIHELFIDKGFRRKGLATKLLGKAIETAAALGTKVVIVSTDKDNTPARGLYKKAGFTESSLGHFKMQI